MIRLNPISTAKWIDLVPGVSILMEPIGTVALKEAGHSEDVRAARDLYPLPEAGQAPDQRALEMRFVHLVKAVAKIVIADWKGVEDDNGEPAPVTHAYIDALLEVNQIYNSFVPHVSKALMLVSEKNG